MKIIIVGAGEVGYNLSKQLSQEGHDIALVEQNQNQYAKIVDSLDVHAVYGSGTSYKTLENAGIVNADMLVAATTSDEVNILAVIMAKRYNVDRTIARVKNPEFLHEASPINAKKLNIDMIVHPESEAAVATIKLLKQTAATDIAEFENGQVSLIGIQMTETCTNLFIPLQELVQLGDDLTYRIVAILRKDITRIPTGKDVIQPGDRVFIIARKDSVRDVLSFFGKETEKIQHIMILGGGQMGVIMAKKLEQNHNVKLIEYDADKSLAIAEKLNKALVIKGDGRDMNLLALEGITDMDAFIAATGDDETNIISCLMARHLEVHRIIALANKIAYTPILPTIGIDAYISKQKLTVNSILKYIRKGDIVDVASIPGIAAEAIEFVAKQSSKITKKPISGLSIPQNVILGAVVRNDNVFIPVGDTQVLPGDKVIVFALPSAIKEIEKMFN